MPRPSVSVKFTPVGRSQTFLLDDLDFGQPLSPGERVVVQTADGRAIGTIVRSIPALAPRRPVVDDTPNRVIRRATHEDVVNRLKQDHRERDAYRICSMKIRERGLPMKLSQVEQTFDGARLVFYFTAGLVHAYITRQLRPLVAGEYAAVAAVGLALVVGARVAGIA